MRKPDFILVGAPKCGTSLMDTYLRRHPDLFMAAKELHYFGADLHFNNPPRTLDNYLSYFAEAADQPRVGESSTWYLYSKVAAKEIFDFNPDCSILIMLRNPVDMVYSLHSHLLYTGNEQLRSFADAIDAEPDRRAGRRIPRHSFPKGALLYHEVASYTDQVARYFDLFGRDRVFVVLAEDFKRDVPGTYQSVLRFLGVREDWDGFEAALKADNWDKNVNKTIRSSRLQVFLKQPYNQQVLRGLRKPVVPGWRVALRAMRRANIVYTDREPMDPALRARLTADFAPEVKRLEALLDRDLSVWNKRKK